jgi:hypothetical protein
MSVSHPDIAIKAMAKPGSWVKVREYSNEKSALTMASRIRTGAYPAYAAAGVEFDAHVKGTLVRVRVATGR